jgi:hypothetical protein
VSGTGVTVSAVTRVSNTQITATFTIAGNATVGADQVTVTSAGGTSAPATFTVTAPPPKPALTGISPASGNRGSSVIVTLTGSNLQGTTAVNVTTTGGFGSGITVSNIAVNAAGTQVTATFTISANTSLTLVRSVTVVNGIGTSNAETFSVTAAPTPTLTGISPTSGARGKTVAVTLTGTNLAPGTTVNVARQSGFGGAGITVNGVTVSADGKTLTANFVISGTTTTGGRNISVTVPGAGANSGNVTFTVN